jgi:peroxiredoxin
MEMAGNTNCLRLECLQQTADWNQPGNDRQAWRRRDTVWVNPSLGVAHKFERSIELKSLREPSQRLLVQYELQTNIQYPGRLFEDRRREILQARTFHMALAPMLPAPAHYPTRTYDAMLAKINHHIDSEPRTPYRDAILQVKRRVESARRGETPAAVGDVIPAARMAVGQAAPDFMTTNLLTKDSMRLRRFVGRPVVMVFYSPNSTKAEELLRFAQRIQNAYRDTVYVLGFALSDDSEHIRQQAKDYQLTMPILSGKGLRQSYAVEATPKLIVLDADGVVRGSYDGWGPETPELVTQEVATSLRRKSGAAQREGKELNASGQPRP